MCPQESTSLAICHNLGLHLLCSLNKTSQIPASLLIPPLFDLFCIPNLEPFILSLFSSPYRLHFQDLQLITWISASPAPWFPWPSNSSSFNHPWSSSLIGLHSPYNQSEELVSEGQKWNKSFILTMFTLYTIPVQFDRSWQPVHANHVTHSAASEPKMPVLKMTASPNWGRVIK